MAHPEQKDNYSKYIYSRYLSNHWIDLIRMIEHNYADQLGARDTLVVGYCAFQSIDEIKQAFNGADRYIVYQLEPLHDKHWHSIDKVISHIRNADEVWDYDLDNIKILKENGINAKFKPFLYTESLKRIQNRENLDIDILFYGTPTVARNEMFYRFCHNHILTENLQIVYNCQGDQLDEYISRSKIILDLHTDPEYNIQKQTRIFYALINGKCVISEKSKRNYYGDLIVECDRESLPATVVEYIRSNLWQQQSSMVSEKFKSQSTALKNLFFEV